MPSLRLLRLTLSASLDRAAAARAITEQRPHVVCVHGAPSLLRWRSLSAQFARNSGLVVVSGGRTGGGNLLLSTLGVDVEATQDATFPGGHGLRRPGITVAALRLSGSRFTLAGASLGTTTADRSAHLTRIHAAVAGIDPRDLPVVLSVQGADADTVRSALGPDLAVVAGGILVDERLTVTAVEDLGHGVTRADLELPT